MTDINLDEEAKDLRTIWNKAQNMYGTFFARLQSIRDEMANDHHFARWCIDSLGVSVGVCSKASGLLTEIDAAIQKQKLATARQIDKEQKRQARDDERARKEQQQKEKDAEKKATARQRARKRQAKLVQLPTAEGPSPEAHQLLAECAAIEMSSRVELGGVYSKLKERVDLHQEGKDAAGKWWTWTGWAAAYIPRSLRDIQKCIAEFNTSNLENAARCRVTHNADVQNIVHLSAAQ